MAGWLPGGLAGSQAGCPAPKTLAGWLPGWLPGPKSVGLLAPKTVGFLKQMVLETFCKAYRDCLLDTKIAYRDCIYRLHLWSHRKIAYMDCIQRLHIKIAYKDCMLRFHTKIEYKDWIQRLHTSITYKDCVHKHMIQILWIKTLFGFSRWGYLENGFWKIVLEDCFFDFFLWNVFN